MYISEPENPVFGVQEQEQEEEQGSSCGKGPCVFECRVQLDWFKTQVFGAFLMKF